MSEPLMNHREQRQVAKLVNDAMNQASEALAITRRAESRIVNGNVNVTIQYKLKDAIKALDDAIGQITA